MQDDHFIQKGTKMKLIIKVIRDKYWSLYFAALKLLGFIILFFLYIVKPFKFVKLLPIIHTRIGHLASNTDLFLRRLQLKRREKEGIFYLGVSGKPVNQQLLTMFKRKLPIIQNDHVHRILNSSPLNKSPFYEPLPCMTNEYYEFNNTEPNLYFTASEEKKGKKLLKKMGINDNSWFVCFHSRDSAYLEKEHSSSDREKWRYHDYRDSDIENYLKAAEYITSQGGYAIRVGKVINKKLPDLNNPQIIDYATKYRSDFGDIYLHAKCKFSLGDTAGIWSLPTIFHVPVAEVNFTATFQHTPLRKGDLFIPKKVWSIKDNRFLTFREIMESKLGTFQRSQDFAEAGVVLVENTADEILDLAKEMNQRLDGKFKTAKEDEELQKKFRSLYKPHYWGYGSPARTGTKFLRENKELLT